MSRSGHRFVCVDDGVPEETIGTLRSACEQRDVPFEHLDAARHEWGSRRRLGAGDLLYRPAVSQRALAVEQSLHGPGVTTFYAHPDGPFVEIPNSWRLHERSGLPVPTTVPLHVSAPADLEPLAASVGGFPLILRVGSYSGGTGVLRVDSMPALVTWARYLRERGQTPDLVRYVPHAVHWRIVVVGRRAVASYLNPLDDEDFRSYASEDPADYRAGAEAEHEQVAVAAVAALGLELGGVDLLVDADDHLWLLEANFPCYHPQAQVVGGIDVAGAMVDHLLGKARTLG